MNNHNDMNLLYQEVSKFIWNILKDLNLDVDAGIEVFLYPIGNSGDIDIPYLIGRLKNEFKITYVYNRFEEGYIVKKIGVGKNTLVIGVRPAIL